MKQQLYVTALLIVAITGVINLLAGEFYWRIDLTEGRQYTLSKATIDILEGLKNPVTVKAYFSENLPPAIAKTRRNFQEMLIEYARRSNGLLLYEFTNPNQSGESEREAVQQGIQPVLINVREKDQVKQQKAFLGAVIASGEKVEAIPFMQPGGAMEYALSTAIKKINIEKKIPVGFLQGHGEPALNETSQLQEQLSILYAPQAIDIDTTAIPATINTLVIIRPTDSIPAEAFSRLDEMLARGGRIAIAMNRVDGNLQTGWGGAVNTGLEAWLAQKGLKVEERFVADASCGAVTVRQQQGFFTMQTNVAFPYIPMVNNFADHPVTKGLEAVLFQFASPMDYTGDSTWRFTPLAFSSDKSNAIAPPLRFDIEKQWTDEDLPLRSLTLAAALEKKTAEGPAAKIVVIADGDFVINGPGPNARNLEKDHVSLMANAIDWLSDDTGLIALRTKEIASRPIKEMGEDAKTALKYFNFLFPLALVAVYGLIRMQQNRTKRRRRAAESYEEKRV